jgi:hypothetical protein
VYSAYALVKFIHSNDSELRFRDFRLRQLSSVGDICVCTAELICCFSAFAIVPERRLPKLADSPELPDSQRITGLGLTPEEFWVLS